MSSEEGDLILPSVPSEPASASLARSPSPNPSLPLQSTSEAEAPSSSDPTVSPITAPAFLHGDSEEDSRTLTISNNSGSSASTSVVPTNPGAEHGELVVETAPLSKSASAPVMNPPRMKSSSSRKDLKKSTKTGSRTGSSKEKGSKTSKKGSSKEGRGKKSPRPDRAAVERDQDEEAEPMVAGTSKSQPTLGVPKVSLGESDDSDQDISSGSSISNLNNNSDDSMNRDLWESFTGAGTGIGTGTGTLSTGHYGLPSTGVSPLFARPTPAITVEGPSPHASGKEHHRIQPNIVQQASGIDATQILVNTSPKSHSPQGAIEAGGSEEKARPHPHIGVIAQRHKAQPSSDKLEKDDTAIHRLRIIDSDEIHRPLLHDRFIGADLPNVEIVHGKPTLELLDSADCLILPIPLNPAYGPTPFLRTISELLGDSILQTIRRVFNKGFGALPPNSTTLIPLFSPTGSAPDFDRVLNPNRKGPAAWASMPTLGLKSRLSYILCVAVWKGDNSSRREGFVRDAFRAALMEVDTHNGRFALSSGGLDGGAFASRHRFIGELLTPHFISKEMTRPNATAENMALAYFAYAKAKQWIDPSAPYVAGDFTKSLAQGTLVQRGIADLRELRELIVRAANVSQVTPISEQTEAMQLLNCYIQRPSGDPGTIFWTRDNVLQFIRDQALQYYSLSPPAVQQVQIPITPRKISASAQSIEPTPEKHSHTPVWLEALVANAVSPKTPDEIKFKPYKLVNFQDVELGATIGRGSFGRVRRGTLKVGDGPLLSVALKEISLSHFRDPRDVAKVRKELAREVTIMSIIKHPRILPCLGARWTDDEVWILTELADCDLFKHLATHPPSSQRLRIAQQVAEGMMHLHSLNYMHRDLKSLNVLVFHHGGSVDVKVADFGSCRVTDFTMTMEVGTPRWTAPEVFGGDYKHYSHKADVYSFGIMMWELLMMTSPYADYKGHAFGLTKKIMDEGLRPSIPPTLSPTHPFIVLTKRCWDANPNVRPSFSEVLATLLQIPDIPDPNSLGSPTTPLGAPGGGRPASQLPPDAPADRVGLARRKTIAR